MAQRYSSPTMKIKASTSAPPVLSLTTDLLHDHDHDAGIEPGVFLMDDAESMQEIEHTYTFDPLYTDLGTAQADGLILQQEVVHAGAHLAGVESGSAYRALAGQLAIPPADMPSRLASFQGSIQMELPSAQQLLPDMRLPASLMPQTTAYTVDIPTIDVSQWPQYGYNPEQEHFTGSDYDLLGSQYDDDFLTNTPSNSFQSTGSFRRPWSRSLGSSLLGRLDEDLLSSNTAPSSFDFSAQSFSGQPSLPAAAAPFPDVRPRNEIDQGGSMNQLVSTHQEYNQMTTPYGGTNVSSWTQGAYNVSDRTNFGGLAPESSAPPGPRRRKTPHSRAGSATALPCERCGKIFASKSARDHHARWHGPKAQICAVCDKGFVAIKDLRRHEKTHRPAEHEFFCDYLGCVYNNKGFARKDHFVRHRKTHGNVISSLDAIPGCSATF